MHIVQKELAAFATGFTMIFMASVPVLADDTEIYFAPQTANASNTNIMFVLDTSGSMGDHDADPATGQPKVTSRLDDMKIAFRSVLESINNVNVGIMRFSNAGGPVLYPAVNIDKELTDDSLPPTISISAGTGKSTNDAYQYVSDGAVIDGSNQLYMGHDVTRPASTGGTATGTLTQSADDAEYYGTTLNTTNTVLRTPRQTAGGAVQINGVRFSNGLSGIPYKAIITDAKMNFYVDSRSSGGSPYFPYTLAVVGELVDKGIFSNTQLPSTRYLNTSNTTSGNAWTLASRPATGAILSPEVTSIMNSIVNDSNWSTAANRKATFLFSLATGSTGTGYVNLASYDYATTAQRPTLAVTYRDPNTTEQTITALRFEGVNVPKGVMITEAHIDFVADSDQSSPTNLKFYGELSSNAAALSTTANSISSKTRTSASVDWTNVPSWISGATYSSPDIKSVIQEIVNQGATKYAGWCGDNALTILVTSDLGQRIAKAYESGSGYAPKLSITYDPSTMNKGNTCRNVTVSRQILNASDDAEDLTNGQIATGSTTINLAYASSGGSNVARSDGFHFTNVQVPKDATISSAYLEFTAKNADTSTGLNLTVNAIAVDNPGSFFAPGDIRSKTKTSASVSWSGVESWAAESTYRSPNISSVIQELVNRSGWESGNDMSVVVSGSDTSKRRRAYSFEGAKNKSTRLIIKFRDDGTYTASYRVRDLLIDTVDSFTAGGFTPSQDTLYEAALYYKGGDVDYGLRRGGMPGTYCATNAGDSACSGPYSYTRVSTTEALVNGSSVIPNRPVGCTTANMDAAACAGETLPSGVKYKSPVVEGCSQNNSIVFLTDGLPNSQHSTSKIQSMTGVSSCVDSGGAACVTELTKWLHTTGFDTADGIHTTVTTHTIGLYEGGGAWLEEVATEGGGTYHTASNAEEIQAAFDNIIDTAVTATSATFVAAGTAVNAFDRTLNRNELYFSVFKPESSARWAGNIKKYKLAVTATGNIEIQDAHTPPLNAVDASGFFSQASRSYWTDPAINDGPNVVLGGAGGEITDYNARKVYTYYDVAHPTLSDPVNRITSTSVGLNVNLTKEMFGASSYTSSQFEHLVDWTLGRNYDSIDSTASPTDTRFVFGDPLHSRPVTITYRGPESNPDMTIFVSTNAGFLHAIDANDGHELFAFIPQDLLPIQKDLFTNLAGAQHIYGLDGAITPWVIDPDEDGLVLSSGGSIQADNKVMLYVGMRRGGRGFYALDVTDRNNPKLAWEIKGGVTSGFNGLGQTWSQPVKARIRVGSTVKRVLIFGGGYDEQQDSVSIRTSDSMGNAIYIVDAMNGSLIWSGGKTVLGYSSGFPKMLYSIPSTVSAADVDGDSLTDVFFVGDMGGQVWRFDIHQGESGSSLVTGGAIADLGAGNNTPTAANARRFYHAPTLFLDSVDGRPYLGVALGSGYRAHPLNDDIVDRFYTLRQFPIYSAPASYDMLDEDDLFDASDNVIQLGSDAQKEAAINDLNGSQGWYKTLPNVGEKVLSAPLVLNSIINFTSFEPVASSNSCLPGTGKTRLYRMNIQDGTAQYAPESGGFLPLSQEISVSGIIDSGTVIQTTDENGNPIKVLCTGTQCRREPDGEGNKVKRLYWFENRK